MNRCDTTITVAGTNKCQFQLLISEFIEHNLFTVAEVVKKHAR